MIEGFNYRVKEDGSKWRQPWFKITDEPGIVQPAWERCDGHEMVEIVWKWPERSIRSEA